MINTLNNYEVKYGYFECHAKLQKQIGHWSAFWLQSPSIYTTRGDNAKGRTEIDVFEYLSRKGDVIQQALHWDGYQEDRKSKINKIEVSGISAGWHTFGLLWTDKQYTVWTTTQSISKRTEYLRRILEIGNGLEISQKLNYLIASM